MQQSVITRAMTQDGSARIVVCNSSALVERAHEIHNTSKTMTATLGRCLTAASLMGCLLKDKTDVLTLQIDGDGPAGRIVCISDYLGNVRGWAENPDTELPPNEKGKLNVGDSVGAGTLTVLRDTADAGHYGSTVNLVSGEIGEDITQYYAESEQIPTVCALGVLADTDCSCRAAGGFLLQLLPGYDEAIIPQIEANIAALPPVSSLIRDGLTGEEIIGRVLSGIPFDLFDTIPVEYRCNCNREKYARALLALGKDELCRMAEEDRPVEIRCRYCRKQTTFSAEEIRDMIAACEQKEKESNDEGEATDEKQ